MKDQNEKMSFLPEDYVERRIERRTNLICLTLFAVVLGGVIAAYFVTNRHREEVRAERRAVNVAYTEAAKRLEQLDQLQKRKQQMLRKAQITSMLIEPVPRTFLLADLINRMPKTLSLIDLKLTSKVVTPMVHVDRHRSALINKTAEDEKKKDADEDPVPKYRVSLSIIGVAPTDVQVAQYMASLSHSPLMSDINLVFSEETQIENTPMRRFRIEAVLNPNADVRSLKPGAIPQELKKNPMHEQSPPLPSVAPKMPKAGASVATGSLEN